MSFEPTGMLKIGVFASFQSSIGDICRLGIQEIGTKSDGTTCNTDTKRNFATYSYLSFEIKDEVDRLKVQTDNLTLMIDTFINTTRNQKVVREVHTRQEPVSVSKLKCWAANHVL